MGTYNNDWKEIADVLITALDNIEGDFSNDELAKALTFISGYAPTIDSNPAREKEWSKKLKEFGE